MGEYWGEVKDRCRKWVDSEDEEAGKRVKRWVEAIGPTAPQLISKPSSSQLTATIFP